MIFRLIGQNSSSFKYEACWLDQVKLPVIDQGCQRKPTMATLAV
jgi:hypothetical protein